MAEWYTPLSIYPIGSSGRGITSELDLGPFWDHCEKEDMVCGEGEDERGICDAEQMRRWDPTSVYSSAVMFHSSGGWRS